MVQIQKLGRFKRLLGQTRKPNTDWKPNYGLLARQKLHPLILNGYPQFEKPYDPENRRTPPTQKKYRPPFPAPVVKASRESADYNEDNIHQLKSKFQFEVKGMFHDKGYLAEKEVFNTAFNLHLVGWLKIRSNFMLGHVQGDTYALSYFKKYLEEKHLSKEAGTIDWVRLFEYNTGLSTPLHYRHLYCEKDWRKYRRRKAHIMSLYEKWQIRRLQQESLERREKELKLIDEKCLREY
eukprot:symbB.v1.2.031668.t1/scaffold3700.1/size51726/7